MSQKAPAIISGWDHMLWVSDEDLPLSWNICNGSCRNGTFETIKPRSGGRQSHPEKLLIDSVKSSPVCSFYWSRTGILKRKRHDIKTAYEWIHTEIQKYTNKQTTLFKNDMLSYDTMCFYIALNRQNKFKISFKFNFNKYKKRKY